MVENFQRFFALLIHIRLVSLNLFFYCVMISIYECFYCQLQNNGYNIFSQKINTNNCIPFFDVDVDTHEPDEKSLITYISSLHEVFPEPPPIHPLYDSVSQQRMQEYREIASSLHMWMREKYSLMQVSQMYTFKWYCVWNEYNLGPKLPPHFNRNEETGCWIHQVPYRRSTPKAERQTILPSTLQGSGEVFQISWRGKE